MLLLSYPCVVPKVFPDSLFPRYLGLWTDLWDAHVWNATVPYYIVEYEKLKSNIEDTLIGVFCVYMLVIDIPWQ